LLFPSLVASPQGEGIDYAAQLFALFAQGMGLPGFSLPGSSLEFGNGDLDERKRKAEEGGAGHSWWVLVLFCCASLAEGGGWQ